MSVFITEEKREEVRCNEETATDMLHNDSRPVQSVNTFQAALGIPLVVDEKVPMGVVQFWRGNKMIREVHL